MTSSAKDINPANSVSFRLSYILLPTVVLAASLLLTAVFYSRLPAELAYHFTGDGTPDGWLGRNQIVLLTLFPQVILTFIAAATVWGMTKFSSQQVQIAFKMENIISLMGNMVALPEIILAFFMLDVYLYNTYKVHVMSIWGIAIIVMLAGAVFLAIFFFNAFRKAGRTTK